MKARRCSIAQAEPGMALAYPIVKEHSQLILAEGTVLTDTIIEQLKYHEIEYLDIMEKKSRKLPFSPTKTFDPLYCETVQAIKNCFSTIRYFKEVPLGQMKELIDTSIDPLVDALSFINHLYTIRRQDDYTFYHSLNVAVISGILGKWIGLSGLELKEVILAGLLHDIGKTQIPVEILNKPAKLTPDEMESMKRHSLIGYELLAGSRGISESVLYGVLQHHERMDGSGYPYGLPGKKIHSFAKIIAVADTYDAMTSDRVYRKKRLPFDVIEVISQEMYSKLDPSVCFVFLNNATNHLIGTKVKLNDGREAEVIYRGDYYSSRPTVYTQDGEFIDLQRNKGVQIIELV
ncbi:Hypothetical protein LUCI_4148 [Lucifera butyrica]|uniref:Uncharacterized protein n=1 Tax=Lucifera butyrica TaxID=1351585 RepID=A0A498RCT6_9FIRM|nr:HD-GYP domain-containing protein [Lucifera butyrica]VBB08865.1 Hypothetical protein LUCI_4148 [Lucifera butyrica]